MIEEPQATSYFLVERYVPVTDLDVLVAAVARAGRACAAGTGVRYLHSTYIPDEDTCFCVFQAPSAESVRAINEAARFDLDRIASAIGLDAAVAGLLTSKSVSKLSEKSQEQRIAPLAQDNRSQHE